MRDICNLFEQLGEEFNRLHILDFLPILSEKWNSLRRQNGFVILDKVLELYNIDSDGDGMAGWEDCDDEDSTVQACAYFAVFPSTFSHGF